LKRLFIPAKKGALGLGRFLQDILPFYGRGNKGYEEYYKIAGLRQL
jgi:hypothetical protein